MPAVNSFFDEIFWKLAWYTLDIRLKTGKKFVVISSKLYDFLNYVVKNLLAFRYFWLPKLKMLEILTKSIKSYENWYTNKPYIGETLVKISAKNLKRNWSYERICDEFGFFLIHPLALLAKLKVCICKMYIIKKVCC